MTAIPSHAQRILVLGATGGVGGALARRLAAAGGQVALAGRDPDRLQALAAALDAPALALPDVGVEQVEACVTRAAEALDGLDGIANCVGSLLLQPAHRTTSDEWAAVLHTNLGSAFATVRAGAPVLRKKGGAIVLVASAVARMGMASHEAIAAAKAGVVGLTRSAAATYAPKVRVNAVAPGMTETPLTAGLLRAEAMRRASEAMHPLGRIGAPEDIAAAMAWLLGPESAWITGQVLGVDGGLASVRSRRG